MTQPATIAISVGEIIARVLAAAALRHLLDASRPPLLHSDHSEALAPIVRSCFADICLAMVPYATDCNLDSGSHEILTLDVSLPENAAPSLIRAIIERALTSATLAEAYRGADSRMADSFDAERRHLIDASLSSLSDASFSAAPPEIKPYMF